MRADDGSMHRSVTRSRKPSFVYGRLASFLGPRRESASSYRVYLRPYSARPFDKGSVFGSAPDRVSEEKRSRRCHISSFSPSLPLPFWSPYHDKAFLS